VTSKRRVSDIMSAMSEGRVRPLFDAMAEDVTWRWMGVKQWTRSFNGKQTVIGTLFGGNALRRERRDAQSVIQRRGSLHPC
jgi:hypothetical protein